MPDKRAWSWRACGPAEMLPCMQNQCFRCSSPSLLLSFFPNIRDCFLRKKRELGTQFSFLCMSTTVSGSNSLSFPIIEDQSLEVWQRAFLMTGDTDTAKSSKLFFPSIFFACFVIFLKKAFSERKIALEIFPKKDEGTGSINDERAFWDRSSSIKGRQSSPVWPPTKKMPLPLLYCTSLLSSSSSDGEGFLLLLEKITKGDLAISKMYPEPDLFFGTLLGPQTCFLFVRELVSIRLSDSKWGNSPPAKVKPVED